MADFATLSDLSVTDGAPVYYWKDGYKSAPVLMDDTDRPQNRNSFMLVVALALVVAALVAFVIQRHWRLNV